MKQIMLLDKYPVFTRDLPKAETECRTVDEVVTALRKAIDGDPRVQFIGDFDHLAHTRRIGGDVNPEIQAARNLVFCFGVSLPNAGVLALRPRSIGIADLGDRFVINFLEPPMAPATEAMTSWIGALAR